jgi:hypothetical protein
MVSLCILIATLLVEQWVQSIHFLIKDLCELLVANGASSVTIQVTEQLLEFFTCKSEVHFFADDSEFLESNLVVEVAIEVAESLPNFFEFLKQPL